ncbi:MAG: Rpn family recombination-promoting nuclease/putative transposase, partial [Saprospiraceae bacterium]
MLLDFLKEVLPGKHTIRERTCAHSEQLGNSETDRKAIFDLYCTGKNPFAPRKCRLKSAFDESQAKRNPQDFSSSI